MAKRRDPAKRSARARQDAALKVEVGRVFDENFRVYGVRKVWRQLKREGFDVARCTVSRLMLDMGLQGVIRGKPVKTTISDKAAPCPLDHVNRQFKAPRPNVLWLSDFTYVATWTGFVYVAFVIDAYARRIVGCAPHERPMPASCQSAFKFGSDAILVQSWSSRADETGLKQIELGTSVHLPLNELELGDLALCLAVRP